jgi:phosphopantetheinyl transferase
MEALSFLAIDERPPLRPGQVRLWLHELPKTRDHEHAHALLRNILSGYLDCLPEALPLRCEAGCAPRLDGHDKFSLSLSYADNLLVLGCGKDVSHGIDLVRIGDAPDWSDVAGVFLAPAMVKHLQALPAPIQESEFAKLWSGLEARGKSLGQGLREYSPARDSQLYAETIECLTASDMPTGYCLSLAVARNSRPDTARRN